MCSPEQWVITKMSHNLFLELSVVLVTLQLVELLTLCAESLYLCRAFKLTASMAHRNLIK